MKSRLLEILACPECCLSLRLIPSECNREEIVSGLLVCGRCTREFPIRGGIPRFVAGENYASTFGFEWKKWRRTQFDTQTQTNTRSTFEASTGRLSQQLAGKLVLDAGCGAGRYMHLL